MTTHLQVVNAGGRVLSQPHKTNIHGEQLDAGGAGVFGTWGNEIHLQALLDQSARPRPRSEPHSPAGGPAALPGPG